MSFYSADRDQMAVACASGVAVNEQDVSVDPQRVPAGSASQWRPPMELWRLYLLSVLTFSVYLFFWNYHVAAELRRNLNSRIRPWLYVVGLLLPVVNLFVIYRLARHIRRLRLAAGMSSGLPPVVTAFLASPLVVGFLHSVVHYSKIPSLAYVHSLLDPAATMPGQVVLMLLVPLPNLVMQQQLNQYKFAVGALRWTDLSYRFRISHYAGMAGGLLLLGGIVYANANAVYRYLGTPLAPGQVLSGTSGLYNLTIGEGQWVQVSAGRIVSGSDLSLFGPTDDTIAVVQVNCAPGNMDDLVEYRRQIIKATLDRFSGHEERHLLSSAFLPVSFARYSGVLAWPHAVQTWWVATVATKTVTIEVITSTTANREVERQLERLVKSLRIIDGEKPCGPS